MKYALVIVWLATNGQVEGHIIRQFDGQNAFYDCNYELPKHIGLTCVPLSAAPSPGRAEPQEKDHG